jgi:hypothetical protein
MKERSKKKIQESADAEQNLFDSGKKYTRNK